VECLSTNGLLSGKRLERVKAALTLSSSKQRSSYYKKTMIKTMVRLDTQQFLPPAVKNFHHVRHE
jgi:hypothetical protein